MTFRKSSYSGTTNGSCVEVAGLGGRFAVRDSKDTAGPVLGFTAQDWTAFVAGVRDDAF